MAPNKPDQQFRSKAEKPCHQANDWLGDTLNVRHFYAWILKITLCTSGHLERQTPLRKLGCSGLGVSPGRLQETLGGYDVHWADTKDRTQNI